MTCLSRHKQRLLQEEYDRVEQKIRQLSQQLNHLQSAKRDLAFELAVPLVLSGSFRPHRRHEEQVAA